MDPLDRRSARSPVVQEHSIDGHVAVSGRARRRPGEHQPHRGVRFSTCRRLRLGRSIVIVIVPAQDHPGASHDADRYREQDRAPRRQAGCILSSPRAEPTTRVSCSMRWNRSRGSIQRRYVTSCASGSAAMTAPIPRLSASFHCFYRQRSGDPFQRHTLSVTTTLAAVLWDMDGTLIDSEPIWIAQQFVLVEQHGGTWSTEQGLALVGGTCTTLRCPCRPRASRWSRLSWSQRSSLRSSTRCARRAWARGCVSCSQRCGGTRCRVPSPPPPPTRWRNWSQMKRRTARSAWSSGPRTSPRPNRPQPYLRAAELLGVRIEQCVAVEDSPNGLASAIASGAATIAVPNDALLPEAGAFTTWPTLEGRTVADLAALLR